jgi:TolB-like protein/DNA-binding winged helix-turn-helix (wHTH) protein/Tfp pilus assembly protein PilF/tRNA A-37 threonylcarbamoyl transferase component Bud32
MQTVPGPSRVLKFGVFEVDLQAGELRRSGMRQKLAGQPFQVLQLLLEHPNEIITREELRQRIWPGNTFIDYDLALKKAVNRLREVLSDSAESPHFIETIPRRGYRFIAPIQDAGQVDTLGRYRLTGKIGAGGMGEVYHAQDLHLGREVAVKVLPPDVFHDENARNRFRREAELLCRLNHPNIATVYDFETRDGIDFLVMEYIRGVPLSDKVAAGPLPEKDVLRFGLQLAEGIAAAHEQGVTHRDLKPGNLRITSDGWLKILDFGLARAIGAVSENTATQTDAQPAAMVEGTLLYMAPEQLRGQTIDARTDVYAAGCVLYDMATGKVPFDNKLTTALVDAILHQSPPTPRQLNSAVSPRLEEIILKCLEKDPADRYQSARELAVDLRRAAPSTVTAAIAPSPRRIYWPAALLFAAVALVIAIALGVANPGEWRARLFGGAAAPVRTIAVLPLLNLSSDPAQDYFADGMTEALTTDLARMESLQVISRTSAMRYKAAQKSLPAIARELKADAVVEGSVQRSGNRVRVTAQLVRAADDRHLWADHYERDFRDVLALQDEVASDIAKQIESRLGGPRPAPVPKMQVASPEAYETYLKANYYFDAFDLQKSVEYYNQAIKLDPNYAPTYAHMALAYSFMAFFGEMSPSEGWGKVKEAATLAVQKDERLPEGHAGLALAKLHYDWDFAGAEREFKRALELNASDADTHHEYAHYLMAMGRLSESQAESKRAVELDPMGEGLKSCLCWHSFAVRDYDESVRLAEHFLKSQPNDPWEHTILGWTYEQKRMPDQAIAEFKKAVESGEGDSFFLAPLGHAYALAGNRREAEKVLQTLSDRAKKSYVSPFDVALIYTALGEKDKAFALLDKALAERSTFLVYSKWEPRLDPLRSDPRFKQLLKQIGLPQ